MNDNDKRVVAYNAYRASMSAYDLLAMLLHEPDEHLERICADLHCISSDLHDIWARIEQNRG